VHEVGRAQRTTPGDGFLVVSGLRIDHRAHAEEFAAYEGAEESLPEAPIVFTKPVAALCGPQDDIAVDPELATALDYEVELGVVIGVGGRRIAAEESDWGIKERGQRRDEWRARASRGRRGSSTCDRD